MYLIYIIFVAISISMDTFSISLNIGKNLNNKFCYALLVGLLHFILTILGSMIGNIISIFLHNMHLLSSIVFLCLAFNMYNELKETNKTIKTNTLNLIIISFSVSMDSLSIGLTINKNIILSASIFLLATFSFTYIGLLLGKYLNDLYGKKYLFLGFILLTFIGVLNFFKFIINFICF